MHNPVCHPSQGAVSLQFAPPARPMLRFLVTQPALNLPFISQSSEVFMAIKVGINGFGRIGRNVLRAALTDRNLEFVAVNDLTDPKTLAHLLKYDSILGNLSNDISAGGDCIRIDGRSIRVFAEKDPAKLPWDSVGARSEERRVGKECRSRRSP